MTICAAGCGAANGGRMHTGELQVTAVEGPTCPAQRAGAPPCVAPYHGLLEILDSSGGRVAEVTTSAAGTATVSLPAGNDTVTAPTAPTGFPHLVQPARETVAAGSTVLSPASEMGPP